MKDRPKISLIILMVLMFFPALVTYAGQTQRHIMGYPDVHEATGMIVFSHGNDLWKVPVKGGEAVRLTIHDGAERFPRFSPDGKLIAFTAEYDGNTDVYVMSVNGGNITRLTYHPGADTVVGWHPVKNKIIFTSGRTSFNRFRRLFLISPDGTGIEQLILNEATKGSFSPDGNQIAYNKVSRDTRTWKRYRGGLAQDIYLYDYASGKDKKLTSFKGTDRDAMWIGDKIYFVSDRDEVLNIYSYHTGSGNVEQVTHHTGFDVLHPGFNGSSIVYELGGTIQLLNVKTNAAVAVPISIKADAPERRPYLKTVKDDITGFDFSPTGKRAIITARGEIFTVPSQKGPTRNLTNSSGARDKNAVWSPDGKTIAWLSDGSGEYEIYLGDPRGKTKSVKLTSHKDGYRHTLRWSPDSKKIAFADQTLAFYYLDVTSRKIVLVDRAKDENVDISLDLKPIYDFKWSPDSRFLTYSKMDTDQVTKVYIYSLETAKIHCVSNGIFNDFSPVFTKDGNHLLFISNRRFNPTYCDFEWEMVYKKVAGIYSLTLSKDGKRFLQLKSDEGEEVAGKKEGDEGKKKSIANINIDFEGLSERIQELPVPRGNYRYLAAGENALYYLNAEEGDFNRFEYRSLPLMNLFRFDLEEREEKKLAEGVRSFKLSHDGSHLIYRVPGGLSVMETGSDAKPHPLALGQMKMTMDPPKEWQQIFDEAWRMERDFYYDPNMKGIDWPAMKKKYRKLLAVASCRQDVRFVIGELIGELSTSHTYVFGGDSTRNAKYVGVGMLGADYDIDKKNNLYRFDKIFSVPDWNRSLVPPLSGPGVQVKEGDYLLAVNGVPVTAKKNIYSYFQDLNGKQVVLTVNSKPNRMGARDYKVVPLGGEGRLRYLDWVEHNRILAGRESNGQIGYIHFPDTFNGSAAEFPKYFYSQLTKKAIIVDGRFNGGGLDPDIFLRRLQRKSRSFWTRRYSHHQVGPPMTLRAHFACLTNRYAGSGGDELPYEFQHRKMGPVIGTRSWGGLVGVSMFLQMIDGSGLTAPDYRVYDEKGNWIIENIGVEPDIPVELSTAEMAKGYDAQLMRAIQYLKEQIKTDPKAFPKHKPYIEEKLKRRK